MSKLRSFEAINYMLRPNKNVERKLIVTSLLSLLPTFPLRSYRYVGFGSMWFTDFILMHRVVGISDMITIEREKSRTKRVEFNKPFACITPRMQEAGEALGEVLVDRRTITWLDYDGALKNALSGDIEIAIGAMTSGSVLLISVNAMVSQLEGQRHEDRILDPAEYLAQITGERSLLKEASRLTRNDFPTLVGEVLRGAMVSAALSGKPGHTFVPMWSFSYADDAEMVTVGGMLVNEADRALVEGVIAAGVPSYSESLLVRIDVPILTDKERRALDKLLPNGAAINPNALEFELRPSEVNAYQKYYLHYPVFNEIVG